MLCGMDDPRVLAVIEYQAWLNRQTCLFDSPSAAIAAWAESLERDALLAAVDQIREATWDNTRTPQERVALVASIVGEA